MQIFDELKVRGVEDVLFICMDGVSGLEDGAEAIFKDVVVQLCIVHLVRNSIKYVPSKDYKKFTQSLKKFTEHQALTDAEKHLNSFVRSGHNIPEQLMCGNEISTMSSSFSIMAVPFVRLCIQPMRLKAINSSFRKVTKKGAFPNENALLKLLYLRTTELYKKWNGSKVQNWAMVRNQLSTNEKISARIEKYEHMI